MSLAQQVDRFNKKKAGGKMDPRRRALIVSGLSGLGITLAALAMTSSAIGAKTASHPGWQTTGLVIAGHVITAQDVRQVAVPVAMAVDTNPVGRRASFTLPVGQTLTPQDISSTVTPPIPSGDQGVWITPQTPVTGLAVGSEANIWTSPPPNSSATTASGQAPQAPRALLISQGDEAVALSRDYTTTNQPGGHMLTPSGTEGVELAVPNADMPLVEQGIKAGNVILSVYKQ